MTWCWLVCVPGESNTWSDATGGAGQVHAETPAGSRQMPCLSPQNKVRPLPLIQDQTHVIVTGMPIFRFFHYFWPDPFSIFSYFIFLFLNFLSLFVFIFCETARTHRFSVIFCYSKVISDLWQQVHFHHTPTFPAVWNHMCTVINTTTNNNNRIHRGNWRLLTVSSLRGELFQHVLSSGPGATMCKSYETHRARETRVACRVVRRDNSAIKFDRVQIA